jgi:bifunctional enzyme Fae/Hps
MFRGIKFPHLQVALDFKDIVDAKKVVKELKGLKGIVLEAGTPLIKAEGIISISLLREEWPDAFIVADMKALDVGDFEAEIAAEGGADAAVVSGLAPVETIESFILGCHRRGLLAYIDGINQPNILKVLKALKEKPDVVLLHRGIDEEARVGRDWSLIKKVKGSGFRVGMAGGLTPEEIRVGIGLNVDVFVVGRYITKAKDVRKAARECLDAFITTNI